MNVRGPLSVPQLDAAVDLMGRSGRGAVLPMRGESMVPTLRAGQLVAVELGPFEPERGDLILYRQQDYLVVHRYLGPASREDGTPLLRTRGDGCLGLDPPLERARLRGRVLAIEEHGRWWSLEGGGARAWALAIALHDLTWAAIGVLAGRMEFALAHVGMRVDLQAPLGRTDRSLLRLAHHWLFRALHRSSLERPAGYASASERPPVSG